MSVWGMLLPNHQKSSSHPVSLLTVASLPSSALLATNFSIASLFSMFPFLFFFLLTPPPPFFFLPRAITVIQQKSEFKLLKICKCVGHSVGFYKLFNPQLHKLFPDLQTIPTPQHSKSKFDRLLLYSTLICCMMHVNPLLTLDVKVIIISWLKLTCVHKK